MRFEWVVLIAMIFTSPVQAQVQAEWSEGEHLELADKASLQVCEELGLGSDQCPRTNLFRLDRRVTFSYGELAVAADYYKEPQDLFLDSKVGIRQVLRCAYYLRNRHPLHDPGKGPYTGCDITGFLAMRGYLEVVSQNYDHFGWNNMNAYVRLHHKALEKAQAAFVIRSSSISQSQELINEAVLLNAFADHYLTDAFAAGHVRLPRRQIKQWATRNLKGPLKALRGDGLSLVLHDSEGWDSKAEFAQGLQVQNSRGDVWITRGDQYLHVNDDPRDPNFTKPLIAVKESFKELLRAYKKGELPTGTYVATTYVPFVKGTSLVDKFSPDQQNETRQQIVDELYKSLTLPQNILFSKLDFLKMLNHLPQIFLSFQADIQRDLNQNMLLRQRLPAEYIEAYLRVK